jgi:hypothetical protein
MKKLTRKQIAEGLQAMPMETLLLGANNTKTRRLTAKQIAFAEEVAKGQTKAEAYRRAYKSKGKPKTASQRGQDLTKNGAIQEQIEAFKVAIEAQKYLLPAHLRALTIHKLTEKALDSEIPPAQQIKALELLGKITEVALFTERREIVQTVDPDKIKDKLLEAIRSAVGSGQVVDVEAHSVESLLAEIAEPSPDPDSLAEAEQSEPVQLAEDSDQSETPSPISNSQTSEPTDPQPPKIDFS